ncbi:MAG: sn-glycerol-3-phosphate ABC transporter ATP-binding protein UgpC [Paracoccaceae bacterium]|nr:sn-glycerol-3-phosphate ABC transporter ATP-binding protein UgpC [Paracoccaceae bacterium]
MATVHLKGLGKTYPGPKSGGVEAVTGIDLDVADGELIVIVGPSGCGKSTLLRMVAGLETITEGTLDIDGNEMNRVEPARRDIAMVFQNYALYPHMSVYKNMAYGLVNRGEPKAEIDRKVREAAATLELSELLERKPAQLSGGQRQRVAMGRAIVRSPKVFLFDEPLSNLDAKLRVQMRIEIKRLQKQLGVTALYVTHDQVEAMTLADRLVAMNGGRVEQIGTPMELYERPASLFVAGFIGTPPMNILPCAVEEGQVHFGDTALVATSLPEHTQVSLGIRPEHVLLCEPAKTPLRGVVDLIEQLGAETLAHISIAGEDGMLNVIARMPPVAPWKEGNAVALDMRASQISLFDTGGRRIEAP